MLYGTEGTREQNYSAGIEATSRRKGHKDAEEEEMHEASYANRFKTIFECVQKNEVYSQNAYLSFDYYRDHDKEALAPNC